MGQHIMQSYSVRAIRRGSLLRTFSSLAIVPRHATSRTQAIRRRVPPQVLCSAAPSSEVDRRSGLTDGQSLSTTSSAHPSTLTWPERSHGCGTLSVTDVPTTITVCGWVDRHRNLGGIIFLDIRDHTGVVQVVVNPQTSPELASIAERLRNEWVVAVTGVVRPRQDPNPRLPTGAIELDASEITVLNTVTRPLPFPVGQSAEELDASAGPREEVRLKHRVLDLRRPRMAANLRLRHGLVKCTRRYLEDKHGFIEIETPILTRSTPEGARDYLVPSRIQTGDWYALPQSPQLFKQMLMVAGYDRYYQVSFFVHATAVKKAPRRAHQNTCMPKTADRAML